MKGNTGNLLMLIQLTMIKRKALNIVIYRVVDCFECVKIIYQNSIQYLSSFVSFFPEMNSDRLNVKDRLGWTRYRNNARITNQVRGNQRQNTQKQSQRPRNLKNQRQSLSEIPKRRNVVRNQPRNQINRNQARQTPQNIAAPIPKIRPENNLIPVNSFQLMFATIPLFVCGRQITATLNSGTTITKVGQEVANMAITSGCYQRLKTFAFKDRAKTTNVLTIPMGTRMARLKAIECIVDKSVPPLGLILGLGAMKGLGYKIIVDRTIAEHHGQGASQAQQELSAKTVEARTESIQQIEFIEGDYIEAITEAEMREIENM